MYEVDMCPYVVWVNTAPAGEFARILAAGLIGFGAAMISLGGIVLVWSQLRNR